MTGRWVRVEREGGHVCAPPRVDPPEGSVWVCNCGDRFVAGGADRRVETEDAVQVCKKWEPVDPAVVVSSGRCPECARGALHVCPLAVEAIVRAVLPGVVASGQGPDSEGGRPVDPDRKFCGEMGVVAGWPEYDPLTCPRCGERRIQFVRYTAKDDQFQHSYYICGFWPKGGQRCGWEGWSVPEVESEFDTR